MNFRSIIEKISRGIVLKRKLSKKFDSRTIYISPEAGLRYWKPTLSEIDPMLLYISEKFIEKNDIIWDIGANVGLFSFTSIIKSRTGKCLSFEPDIWICNLLRKSANQNPDLDVQILPLAVSEEIGFVTFNIANRSRATNFISKATGSYQKGGTRTS